MVDIPQRDVHEGGSLFPGGREEPGARIRYTMPEGDEVVVLPVGDDRMEAMNALCTAGDGVAERTDRVLASRAAIAYAILDLATAIRETSAAK